ncbi:CDP-glycerol glycerophosphotransferase family protein [Cytobacillus sp. FSL R7-0696]|uniref:CDP-glycerol glycerophosphotransferase family protein n=1 Tax=Cytobacillus TaxID=2675230 RepID=UPI0030FA87DB
MRVNPLKKSPELISYKLTNKLLRGRISLQIEPNTPCYSIRLILKQRENGKEINIVEFNDVVKRDFCFNFCMRLNEVEWQVHYYDFYIEFTVGEESSLYRLKVLKPKIKLRVHGFLSKPQVLINKKYHISPYITYHSNLSILFKQKKSYESKKNKYKWIMAFIVFVILRPYLVNKKIWLGYEKNSNFAQDNGFSFFKYCYLNGLRKNYYYVIKKESPDIGIVKDYDDKVIYFMSFKFMLYFLSSSLLISSESKAHIYDIRLNKGPIRFILNRKEHIFLQHGIIGLKQVHQIFNKMNKNSTNLFITSSRYEKDLIKKYFRYNENEIVITGLSRWDNLKSKTTKNMKILIMPTWRSWLEDLSVEEFLNTEYFSLYHQLIIDIESERILKNNDIEVVFFLHPKFTKYSSLFNGYRQIKIKNYEENSVKDELEEASLLITDYSSVAWDFFYLKKPIIFFQFDQKDYLTKQGSYLKLDKELFGDVVYNSNDVLTTMQSYRENNFQEKEKFSKMRTEFFEYIDQDNNSRIFLAIKDFLDKR